MRGVCVCQIFLFRQQIIGLWMVEKYDSLQQKTELGSLDHSTAEHINVHEILIYINGLEQCAQSYWDKFSISYQIWSISTLQATLHKLLSQAYSHMRYYRSICTCFFFLQCYHIMVVNMLYSCNNANSSSVNEAWLDYCLWIITGTLG